MKPNDSLRMQKRRWRVAIWRSGRNTAIFFLDANVDSVSEPFRFGRPSQGNVFCQYYLVAAVHVQKRYGNPSLSVDFFFHRDRARNTLYLINRTIKYYIFIATARTLWFVLEIRLDRFCCVVELNCTHTYYAVRDECRLRYLRVYDETRLRYFWWI